MRLLKHKDFDNILYNPATGESTIGYMMHGYKNSSYSPAIILGDEEISDNPEGGTGKGLFVNALSQMKKVIVIDGKTFNFEKSFPYQTVSADTQILCFDDVKKHFDFERLFSIITEGLTLEKKNKDAIKIPFKKSPKVAITTNYAIEGSGNSFARRKWEVELHRHYTRDHTPYDEAGRHLFEDWDKDEFLKFDNYMLKCLQGYIKKGLQESELKNKNIKILQSKTSRNFIDWVGVTSGEEHYILKGEGGMKGGLFSGGQAYQDFIQEYYSNNYKGKAAIPRSRFYKWIEAYAIHVSGVKPLSGRDSAGKWFIIQRNND